MLCRWPAFLTQPWSKCPASNDKRVAAFSCWVFSLRTRNDSRIQTDLATSPTRSVWRFHDFRIWSRSINGYKFSVKRKTQNVVDFFAYRLFVVVLFLPFVSFQLLSWSARAKLFWFMTLCRHLYSGFSLILLFLSLIFPSSLPFPVCAQSAIPSLGVKLRLEGIPNAGKMNDRLFRGAQPRSAAFAELKRLGVTTIVDLRNESPRILTWERGQAVAHGFRFVHIPVNGWSPPTPEQVAQFLEIFSQDPQQKVFVHCHFGDDRTGVFVAAYRITFDQWSAEQATKEMDYFGFNWLWHPSMKAFILQFPATLNSSPSLAPFRLQKPIASEQSLKQDKSPGHPKVLDLRVVS